MAWTSDPVVPSGDHVMVPRGTQDHIPCRDVSQEISVLPTLWCWVPGLVCLLATGRLHLCLAVRSQQIQDHHL